MLLAESPVPDAIRQETQPHLLDASQILTSPSTDNILSFFDAFLERLQDFRARCRSRHGTKLVLRIELQVPSTNVVSRLMT